MLKTLLARIAGAPPGSRLEPGLPRRPSRDASGLYAKASFDSVARSRTTKQRDGADGEAFARRHLERAGLVFVAANVRFRDGELDLVMREPAPSPVGGATLVFVEVRRRQRATHGGAASSITREKRRRLVAAASHYLVGLGLRTLPPCRFDVVTLDGEHERALRIEWLRDAFRDEG